jgi:hypothetical protein
LVLWFIWIWDGKAYIRINDSSLNRHLGICINERRERYNGVERDRKTPPKHILLYMIPFV